MADPQGAKHRRILVVDDNEDLVENLSDILADAGYVPLRAHSCKSAVEVAKGGFHVALVDLRLPDGEGTTLAVELKQRVPDAAIILLTGHATVESAAAAVRAGAWAYLVKPYATDELLRSIAQAVRHVEIAEERRELARRTEIAERLAVAGTMTAGLSHEIKNPLNAATLQLMVLERRIKQLAPQHDRALLEPLTLVRDEIERLNRILDDFLRFARPRRLEAVPVRAASLVERVTKLLRAQAAEKQVGVREEVAGELVLLGEEERLQQVLMNLVLNAVEASPPGAEVVVTAQPQGREWAVFQVDDAGPGIPTDQRDRVFEPFFTTKPTGSGLGLPIVQAIVSQHGGSIRVGVSPAGGARFIVQVPRASET